MGGILIIVYCIENTPHTSFQRIKTSAKGARLPFAIMISQASIREKDRRRRMICALRISEDKKKAGKKKQKRKTEKSIT